MPLRLRLSSPRRRGSSTPRPLGSIINCSGILDRPVKPDDDRMRVGKARLSAVAQFAKDMVGTAQTRLCPPYRFNLQTALATASQPRRESRASFAVNVLSSDSEGAGNAGRPLRSLARKAKKRTSVVTTVTPVHPTFPAQWFTAYNALSPVTGLFCHRRLRGNNSAKLDASVGASGPHDFAVRRSALSSAAPHASIASRPRSVTIASRPSCRDGTESKYS